MTKSIGGLLASIWLLVVGVVVIINFLNVGFSAPTNDGYFGFQSFLLMFQYANNRLEGLSANPDAVYNNLITIFKNVDYTDFSSAVLGSSSLIAASFVKLFQIIWYILNVPAVLIEILIAAFEGAFNVPYDFSKFDNLVPLMLAQCQQFNVG